MAIINSPVRSRIPGLRADALGVTLETDRAPVDGEMVLVLRPGGPACLRYPCVGRVLAIVLRVSLEP